MKRFIALASVALLALTSPVYANLSEAGSATARYAGLIKVYDATLRVTPGTARDRVLDPQTEKELEIRYRVDIDASDLIKAASKTLERQHSEAELARFSAETEQLHAQYRNVKEGDRFALQAKGDALTLLFNGEAQVTITTPGFADFYLGIWLGSDPLSDSVRDQLLSRL